MHAKHQHDPFPDAVHSFVVEGFGKGVSYHCLIQVSSHSFRGSCNHYQVMATEQRVTWLSPYSSRTGPRQARNCHLCLPAFQSSEIDMDRPTATGIAKLETQVSYRFSPMTPSNFLARGSGPSNITLEIHEPPPLQYVRAGGDDQHCVV